MRRVRDILSLARRFAVCSAGQERPHASQMRDRQECLSHRLHSLDALLVCMKALISMGRCCYTPALLLLAGAACEQPARSDANERITSIATTQPTTACNHRRTDGTPAAWSARSGVGRGRGRRLIRRRFGFAVIDTGSVWLILTEEFAKSRQLSTEQSPTLVMMDAFGQTMAHALHRPRAGDGDWRMRGSRRSMPSSPMCRAYAVSATTWLRSWRADISRLCHHA